MDTELGGYVSSEILKQFTKSAMVRMQEEAYRKKEEEDKRLHGIEAEWFLNTFKTLWKIEAIKAANNGETFVNVPIPFNLTEGTKETISDYFDGLGITSFFRHKSSEDKDTGKLTHTYWIELGWGYNK